MRSLAHWPCTGIIVKIHCKMSSKRGRWACSLLYYKTLSIPCKGIKYFFMDCCHWVWVMTAQCVLLILLCNSATGAPVMHLSEASGHEIRRYLWLSLKWVHKLFLCLNWVNKTLYHLRANMYIKIYFTTTCIHTLTTIGSIETPTLALK